MKKTRLFFAAATLLLSSYNATAQDYDNDGILDADDTEIYWTGATSGVFRDASNWAGKTATFAQWEGDFYVGSGTNETTISGSSPNRFQIYMKEGGVLNIETYVYTDRFKSSAGESSDVYIKDGGTIHVRNNKTDNEYNSGNIHVLTGGTLEALFWRWGRVNGSNAQLYIKGGTVKSEGMLPWQYGYGVNSNTSRITLSENGVITHTSASTLEGWANDTGIIPADGSLLTHVLDSLKIGSIDVTLPETKEAINTGGTYSIPDFSSLFSGYSTGDSYANATITVTQDVAAGTVITEETVVNVTATDYFSNTVSKAVTVSSATLSSKDKYINQTSLTVVNGIISVKNINQPTKINIYGLSGALVKTVTTSTDINFSLNSDIYIATIESVNTGAKKTVKFIVK